MVEFPTHATCLSSYTGQRCQPLGASDAGVQRDWCETMLR
jgi:hypothetical protein